jgi:hypothetical protein
MYLFTIYQNPGGLVPETPSGRRIHKVLPIQSKCLESVYLTIPHSYHWSCTRPRGLLKQMFFISFRPLELLGTLRTGPNLKPEHFATKHWELVTEHCGPLQRVTGKNPVFDITPR